VICEKGKWNFLCWLVKNWVYRDWLEPIPGNQHKAWCSVCGITFDYSRKELNEHAASTGHVTNFQNTKKRKSVRGHLIGKDVRLCRNSVNHTKIERVTDKWTWLFSEMWCCTVSLTWSDVWRNMLSLRNEEAGVHGVIKLRWRQQVSQKRRSVSVKFAHESNCHIHLMCMWEIWKSVQ